MRSGCGSVGKAVASNTEVHGSLPVIGKFYLPSTVGIEKVKTKSFVFCLRYS